MARLMLILPLILLSSCIGDTVCTLDPYTAEAFKTYSVEKQAYMAGCLRLGKETNMCSSFDYCLTLYSRLGVKEETSQPMSIGAGVATGAAALGAAHIIGRLIKK